MIGFKLAAALLLNSLSANKLVLCLAYSGYAWTLVNPKENGIGAASTGPALTGSGYVLSKDVNDYIERYEAKVIFVSQISLKFSLKSLLDCSHNATYVMNYCTINETMWIGFDDVELVQTKVSYAKEKGLLGYIAWQVPNDDNSNRLLIAIINLITIAAAVIVLVLCFVICCGWMRNLKSKCRTKDETAKQLKDKVKNLADAGDFNVSVPNLMVYSLVDIEAATNSFSIDNYLGQGGPFYKHLITYMYSGIQAVERRERHGVYGSSLDDTYSSCKLMRCLRVALLFVQEVPNDRPTMLEVYSMLINNKLKT
ncbi:hypothetical protein ACOSP7_012430 [Xanthoceras sorbifolium]